MGRKRNGALIAMETGTSIAYSIDKLAGPGEILHRSQWIFMQGR
jgi:predicted membrane GTPase involved in stress response